MLIPDKRDESLTPIKKQEPERWVPLDPIQVVLTRNQTERSFNPRQSLERQLRQLDITVGVDREVEHNPALWNLV